MITTETEELERGIVGCRKNQNNLKRRGLRGNLSLCHEHVRRMRHGHRNDARNVGEKLMQEGAAA